MHAIILCELILLIADWLFSILLRYESEVYSDWTQGVDEVAKANLDKPLIVRDPGTLSISVNFDPKVIGFCVTCTLIIHS